MEIVARFDDEPARHCSQPNSCGRQLLRECGPGSFLLNATQQLQLGECVSIQTAPGADARFFITGLRDFVPCLLMSNTSFIDLQSSTFSMRIVMP
eukprot:m.32771 g.32771  ORF g.32771 m.32771 type:complete len:95 (-) comp42570_c0_seq1:1107-1391(-)